MAPMSTIFVFAKAEVDVHRPTILWFYIKQPYKVGLKHKLLKVNQETLLAEDHFPHYNCKGSSHFNLF